MKTGRLVPYIVLNVERQADHERGNFYNKAEETVIIDLVKAASKICGKTPRTGIITYYNRQKQNISLRLKNENLDKEEGRGRWHLLRRSRKVASGLNAWSPGRTATRSGIQPVSAYRSMLELLPGKS